MFRHFVARITSWFTHLSRPYQIGSGLVVLLIVVVTIRMVTTPTSVATSPTASEVSSVHIASVASLSSDTEPLPITGKVTSISQATLLSQSSGEIAYLAHALGDYVGAGEIIARFENGSQKAAVLQAQGAYDAAQAAFAHASGSTTQNSQATSLAVLQNASAALDDAIHIRADMLFTNPRTSSPDLVITVPNSILVQSIKSARVTLESTLSSATSLSQNATPDTVARDSVTMIAAAQSTLSFLDMLIQAVNATPPNQTASAAILTSYQTALSAARSEVLGAISNMTGAKTASDTTNLAAAQASVTQAQGALDAAQALLDKTLIRSPIAGTIVSLPITMGDYITAFSQVAVISNPNALYIDAQVTPDDAKTLSVGTAARIDGDTTGVITFIAQAIDPVTSKIGVKIAITGSSAGLTDGEVVNLSLARTHSTSPSKAASASVIIPISAVKITPDSPVVFTVDDSHLLVAHPITLGSILGNRIVVLTGVTPDMTIVTDARGLAEGQEVSVK